MKKTIIFTKKILHKVLIITKKLVLIFIDVYQYTLFITEQLGLSKKKCMFYPTCSQYTKNAIIKHGILKGLALSSYRVINCNPITNKYINPTD